MLGLTCAIVSEEGCSSEEDASMLASSPAGELLPAADTNSGDKDDGKGSEAVIFVRVTCGIVVANCESCEPSETCSWVIREVCGLGSRPSLSVADVTLVGCLIW